MTHHASQRCTNWWVLFFMEYKKSFLSLESQVDLLEQRGLFIGDHKSAMDFLEVVNYYRFSSYTLSFESESSRSKRSHIFKSRTSFSDIVKVYEFDHSLRLHCLKAIEAIEVAFRTRLCFFMAKSYGSHWYECSDLFIDLPKYNLFLNKLDGEINRSRELFIKHYSERYSKPERPPAWMVIELMSLGTVSKLFRNIKDRKVRKMVAKRFEIPEKVLGSWILSLTFLRNFCAHHARIWNRQFSPIAIPKSLRSSFETTRRFRDCVWCIKELLSTIHRDSSWGDELKMLLSESDFIDKKAMGFGENWFDDEVWN